MARAFRLFPDAKPVSKAEQAEMEYEANKTQLVALLKTAEKQWIQKYVKRRVTKGTDDALDFVVVDDHGAQVAFKSRVDAEGFALAILRAEHPDLFKKVDEALRGKPQDPDKSGVEPPAPGLQAPLDESDVDVFGNSTPKKKPDWWERHKNRAALIDGVRHVDTKTTKRARLL